MAQSMRVAMAKDSGYQSYLSDLSHSLAMLERGEEAVVKESWQSLKDMKKG
jgi:hypothetical protein